MVVVCCGRLRSAEGSHAAIADEMTTRVDEHEREGKSATAKVALQAQVFSLIAFPAMI